MHRLTVLVVLLCGILLPSCLNGEDWYVDNVNGNDRNTGTIRVAGVPTSGPFRTIARALVSAKMGDRIILAASPVPYRESITLQGFNNSGTALTPFTVMGNGAILDGTEPVPTEAWEHFRGNVFRFMPELMHHQELYLDGRPLPRVEPPADGVVPLLEPMQWSLVRGWVYFSVEDGQIPSHYDIHFARRQVGVTLYQVQNVVIQGLTIQGFQLDGINAHDLVDHTGIDSCTVRGNGRSGISVGGASRVVVDGCLVGDNHVAQVRVEGFSRVRIVNTDLVESESHGPNILSVGGVVTVDGEPAGEN